MLQMTGSMMKAAISLRFSRFSIFFIAFLSKGGFILWQCDNRFLYVFLLLEEPMLIPANELP